MNQAKDSTKGFHGAAGGLSGGLKGLVPQLMIAELATKAIEKAGELAMEGFRFVADGVKEAIQNVSQLGREADRLGLTTQALAGLREAAEDVGIGQEGLAKALTHVQRAIGEGLDGADSMQRAFGKLGTSAGELAKMTPDQQLAKLAEGMKGITNPAERTATAMAILGREGGELIPLLLKGSEALEEGKQKAKEYGSALSRFDVSMVQQSALAFKDVKGATEGLFAQLSVALAPVLTVIGKVVERVIVSFTHWLTDSTSGTSVLGNMTYLLLGLFVQLGNALDAIAGIWYVVKAAALESISLIMHGVGLLVDGFAKLMDYMPGVSDSFRQSAHAAAASIHDVASTLDKDAMSAADDAVKKFSDIGNGTGTGAKIQKFADGVIAEMERIARGAAKANEETQKIEPPRNAKAIDDMITRLTNDIATFGMAEGEKQLYEAQHLYGASEEAMTKIRGLVGQMQQLQNQKVIGDIFKGLDEERMTPLDKMVAKLNEAHASAGEISLAIDKFNLNKLEDWADKLKESLKGPAEQFEEFANKVNEAVEQGILTAAQGQAAIDAELKKVGGKGQGEESAVQMLQSRVVLGVSDKKFKGDPEQTKLLTAIADNTKAKVVATAA